MPVPHRDVPQADAPRGGAQKQLEARTEDPSKEDPQKDEIKLVVTTGSLKVPAKPKRDRKLACEIVRAAKFADWDRKLAEVDKSSSTATSMRSQVRFCVSAAMSCVG